MTRDTTDLILIGATGYTGSLVARELASTDRPFVLAARDRGALKQVASRFSSGIPQVVDVLDPPSLRRLIREGDVVLNTAGPFTELGPPVIRACIEAGAHYLDTTGEQPFMRETFRDHDDAARSAGVSIVPAMAFEYALGDCAASLALADLDEPAESVHVLYAWTGTASSRGTRRTYIRMLGRRAWFLEDGDWEKRPQGSRRRSFRLQSGKTLDAVAFGSGEVVTVSRLSDVRRASGWMAIGTRAARLIPLLSPALPFLVPVLRPVLEPLIRMRPDPTAAERANSPFTIRVEARGAGGAGRAVEVRGTDPYGLTAAILVAGALRIRGGQTAAGVLSPADAVEPAAFLESLRPGVEVARTELGP